MMPRRAELHHLLRGLFGVLLAAVLAYPPAAASQEASANGDPQAWIVLHGGPDDPRLSGPVGVAAGPDGSVWVADTGHGRVVRLDREGGEVAQWQAPGNLPSRPPEPWGIAVDAAGHVYVADPASNWVQKHTPGGAPLAHWGEPADIADLIRNPVAVALDTHGRVYVAYAGRRFGLGHRVASFTQAGVLAGEWGRAPEFPWGGSVGQFTAPQGVAVGPDGAVYVADTGNHRVQKLSADGPVVSVWGEHGDKPGQFDEPTGLALGPDGRLYVADTGNHRVQELAADGTVIAAWGGRGSATGQFERPRGIAVGPDGAVFVADTGNNRVQARRAAMSPPLAPVQTMAP